MHPTPDAIRHEQPLQRKFKERARKRQPSIQNDSNRSRGICQSRWRCTGATAPVKPPGRRCARVWLLCEAAANAHNQPAAARRSFLIRRLRGT